MQFTAQNILLKDGRTTMGGEQILLRDSAIWKAIEQGMFVALKHAAGR